MLTLRPYQQAAIEAVYQHLRSRDDNPCVVIPTAGGKTPVIARMCQDAVGLWDGRVLVLAQIKELLEQAADKLRLVCPELKFGIYSAGLKRRDTKQSVILAGIQSVYERASELGVFDLVLVDEAHLIPVDGEGMYRTFLAGAKAINPQLRVVGLTATPYRLKSGQICGPENILNAICYEAGVRELIVQGYLCPLVSKAGVQKIDTSGLHMRGGEFIAEEAEDLMDQDALVDAACEEIIAYTRDRQACLIFTSGVRHGRHVAKVLQERHGVECGFVCGETPPGERDELLARFRGVAKGSLFQLRPLKYLVNVNLLTTGFDAPNIDCVVLLRLTMSPGLYYQMVGRGFRLHPGKANCLILDFGGNILRHGPVDQISLQTTHLASGIGAIPAKECPQCHSVIAAGYANCPDCGYQFPLPEQQHGATASDAGILSGQVTTTVYEVRDLWYSVYQKRGAPEDAPRTMRVDYIIGLGACKSEWICFEHSGYARRKALAWWKKRSHLPAPETAEEAVRLASNGALCDTKRITVRSVAGEEFDRIVDYELGDKPEYREPGWDSDDSLVAAIAEFNPADVPF